MATFRRLRLNQLQVRRYNKKPILMNRSIKGKFLPCYRCCYCFFFLYFFFCWHSVCTTIAHFTIRWVTKFINKVWSTVLDKNFSVAFATRFSFATKADCRGNFTIFHCRMSTIQPAWEGCTTSECWHIVCWHFCSSSSHKTIPSLWEFVTRLCIFRRFVTYLSFAISQLFIMTARIGYKVKW